LLPFSFLFPGSSLRAVQSQEDGGNLRRWKGERQESLQQGLDQSLRKLTEEFIKDERELFFRSAGTICSSIEMAFSDRVDCTCAWQFATIGFSFSCKAYTSGTLAGISGVPEWTGAIDLNPFKLGMEIEASICVKERQVNDLPDGDFCVGGSLCIDRGGVEPCKCKATFMGFDCACKSCPDGVFFNCTGTPVTLPAICLSLPFARSLRPKRNSIDSGGFVEDE
jgi:hypothetical protein